MHRRTYKLLFLTNEYLDQNIIFQKKKLKHVIDFRLYTRIHNIYLNHPGCSGILGFLDSYGWYLENFFICIHTPNNKYYLFTLLFIL